MQQDMALPGLHPLLATRWSPTTFDASHDFEPSDVELLVEAARWAPSAGNSQPWAFVVGRRGSGTHEPLVRHLAGSSAGWAPSASLLVANLAHRYVEDSDWEYSESSLYDLGQAVAHMTLQAQGLGLSVRQFRAFDRPGLAAEFDVPAHWEVTTMSTIGRVSAPPDCEGGSRPVPVSRSCHGPHVSRTIRGSGCSSRSGGREGAHVVDGAAADGSRLQRFPDGPPLAGPRLDLEPLRVGHAEEMALVLDDPGLHVFIGGEPAGLAELQERYRRQAVGHSPDGSQRWLNWVARRRRDGRPVGTVQATVTRERGALVAEVAWVVATPHQGLGLAREAAALMVGWLRHQEVDTLVAHVHPDHQASQGVAGAIGLTPTTTVVDGEIRWQG